MLSLRKILPLPYASMAQLVEQRIRNAQVMGSSPIGSSTEKPPLNVEFSMLGGGFLFAYLITFIYILATKSGVGGLLLYIMLYHLKRILMFHSSFLQLSDSCVLCSSLLLEQPCFFFA